MDIMLNRMLKTKTSPEDVSALNTDRIVLETIIDKDVVTSKSIIAAMKTYGVSHDDKDLERVERMMVKGKKVVNIKTAIAAHGETLDLSPLHAAVLFESKDILKLCLNSEQINILLNFGNLNDPEDAGNLLDLALQVGNVEIIECIFEYAKTSAIITLDDGIPHCLADAVMNNEPNIVEVLLNKESFHPSLNPLMCLMLAIQVNNLVIFTQCLPYAKTGLDTPLSNLSCPLCPASDITVLHMAICSISPRMVRLLVQAGCDVNNTKGQLGKYSPLMQAIVKTGNHHCDGKCDARVISELLCAEQLNLDLQVEDGDKKINALDLVNNKTCPSIKKLVEQAFVRNNLKKKMMKKKENVNQACQSTSSVSPGKKHNREKICWHCSSCEQLSRCAGCRVAWYCGEECQGEDWDRHEDWCNKKERKRIEKAKKSSLELDYK